MGSIFSTTDLYFIERTFTKLCLISYWAFSHSEVAFSLFPSAWILKSIGSLSLPLSEGFLLEFLAFSDSRHFILFKSEKLLFVSALIEDIYPFSFDSLLQLLSNSSIIPDTVTFYFYLVDFSFTISSLSSSGYKSKMTLYVKILKDISFFEYFENNSSMAPIFKTNLSPFCFVSGDNS